MTATSAALPGPGRASLVGDELHPSYLDLGSEPPLSTGTSSGGAPARRAVSMRWLSGTILTGLTSFVLIGGALVAALNGQRVVATAPLPADLATVSASLADGEKGDRFVPVPAPPATREIIPVATMVREGDRDLIQQRDFVLIRTVLTPANIEGISIPDYDPISIVGDAIEADAVVGAAPAGDFVRGEIEGGNAALQSSAFPVEGAEIRGPQIDPAEIEEIVHRNAAAFEAGALPFGAIAFANAISLGFGENGTDPLGALGVRLIPENVSYLGKTGGAGASRDERLVSLADRSLEEVLIDASMTSENIQIVLDVFDGLIDQSTLGEDHRVRIASGSGPIGSTVLRISIYENEVHQATVARDDTGRFVRADEPPQLTNIAETAAEPQPVAGTLPRLYEALYLTAYDQGVQEDQINDFIRIFAFDLDMQARIGPTDSLTLFYSGDDAGTDGAILFASVTTGAGNATSYYRFQGDDGVVRYYDGAGRSADNFLLRKPVAAGELRSVFGNRLHPVLGVYRLHAGVDYTAPQGTPIVAAGDGEIVRMEWNSGGYGRYTVVRHSNGYETAYAHQSGFAQGLGVGDMVRQGQVIGFVGSTGLSTGNHLHYEVRINGQPVNPLTIRLPEGDVLSGSQLAAFNDQREQINDVLGLDETGTRVATR